MNSLCQFLYNPLLLERACAIALLVWLMITTLLIKFFRPRLDKDSETGLPTYTGLVKKHALFENRNLLALVHISNHASITNTLGREYAGALMRSAAQTLSALLPPGTLICRERTDKLLVVLPAMQDISCITLTLKKIESLFLDISNRECPRTHGNIFSGNAGLVHENITPATISDIVQNAGIALHNARSHGNAVAQLFSQPMRDEALANYTLHEKMRDAIQNEEYHLVLQPIIALNDSSHCHEGECLIRWENEAIGYVPPGKFIALAEKSGMIVPMGRWIIETACQELAAFIARGAPADFRLHVNVSAIQLKQPDFSSHLLATLRRFKLDNHHFCLELTESVLLEDDGKAARLLANLREQGIYVAIDDFGSGFSSLSWLHTLPFDCLKIDREFVKDILHDRKSEAVVSSVLGLSRSFKVPLVAEGIETEEMGKKLQSMGCQQAQGFLYGRPRPFSDWHPVHGEFLLGATESTS